MKVPSEITIPYSQLISKIEGLSIHSVPCPDMPGCFNLYVDMYVTNCQIMSLYKQTKPLTVMLADMQNTIRKQLLETAKLFREKADEIEEALK